MNIRKIKIENFGSIQCFEAAFRSDLTILQGIYSEQVALAVRLLMGERLQKWDQTLFSQATKLYAEVECNGTYCVEITDARPPYTVRRQDGEECTNEYLNLINQSSEKEEFNTFSCSQKHDYPHRITQYKNTEKYYPENGFDILTDGVGKTRVFRAALNRFIVDFKPERLRADKELWLTLNDKGEFRITMDGQEKTVLSETEEVLFRYLCFLHLSEFWADVEKIRNINHADKPLIISDLIERIDYTVDLTPYIERTRKSGRQLFLVFPHTEESPHITKLQNKEVVKIEEKAKPCHEKEQPT